MRKAQVIFLINAKGFKSESLRNKLESLTQCKVYDFINFEEASLYTPLRPDLIIYSSHQTHDLDRFKFKRQFKLIDIAAKANQEGKHHIRKHTNLNELLDTI